MNFGSLKASRAYQFINYFLISQMILPPFVVGNVYADIITDPNAKVEFRPVINHVNNVPVVNITKPDNTGLSHNKYEDFDIDKQGVVFNNASVGGNSRLAGYLAANPLLGGRTASTILNEVTGLSDSQLKGLAEVHGDRANVIIANPNGITCNGCGFINTERATFTTGRPTYDQGNLQFDVNQGEVSFEGNGYHYLSYIGQLDILARYIRINSEISTKHQLNLISGQYFFDYTKSLEADTTAQDWVQIKNPQANDRPDRAIAIDGSIFGAMQSGKINIMATEQGTGVKADGYLFAQVDDLFIQSAGDVALNNADSVTTVNIQAQGNVDITSDMIANETININAANISTSDATDMTAGSINLTADGKINLKGDVQSLNLELNSQELDNSADLMAINTIDLTTQGHASLHDADITTNIANWQNGSSRLENINLNIHNFNWNTGQTHWLNTVIQSNTVNFNLRNVTADKLTLLADNAAISTHHWNSQNSTVNTGTLALNSQQLLSNNDNWVFAQGSLSANADLSLLDSKVSSYKADITANNVKADNTQILSEQLTLKANQNLTVDNSQWQILQYASSDQNPKAGTLTIESDNALFANSSIKANTISENSTQSDYQNIQLQSLVLNQSSEQLNTDSKTTWYVADQATINTQQANMNGVLLASRISLKADQANLAGEWKAYDEIELAIQNDLATDGLLLVADTVNSQATNSTFKNSQLKANTFNSHSDDTLSLANSRIESGSLNIQAEIFRTDATSALAAEKLNATAKNIHQQGELFALEQLNINSSQLTNEGQLVSYGDLNLKSDQINNTGNIAALKAVDIAADDLLNSGTLGANTSLSVNAETLHNSGDISALESLSLTANTTLTNEGKLLSANQTLTTDTLNNSGLVNADTLLIDYLNLNNADKAEIASNTATYTAQSDQAVINNLGVLIVRDAVNWLSHGTNSGEFNNVGQLKGSHLHFAGLDQVTNTGSIFAIGKTDDDGNVSTQGVLTIGHEGFTQNGEIVADQLNITRTDFTNSGQIQTDQLNTLTGQFNNHDTLHAKTANINVATLNTAQDSVLSAETLLVQLDQLDNAGTLVGSHLQLEGKNPNTATLINRESGAIVQRTADDASNVESILNIWNFSDFTNQGAIEADNLIHFNHINNFHNQEDDLSDLDQAARIVSDAGIQLENTNHFINDGVLVADALAIDSTTFNNAGVMGAGEARFNVAATDGLINNGRIYQSDLTASEPVRSQLGTTSGLFDIQANKLNNQTQGAIELINADITLNSGELINRGLIAENNAQAGTITFNDLTKLYNYADIQLDSNLNIKNGELKNIGADSFLRAKNIHADNLALFSNEGTVSAEDNLVLNITQFRNTKGSEILANNINLKTSQNLTNYGSLGARTNLDIVANNIVNAAMADLYAKDGKLSLKGASINNQGDLVSGNDMQLESRNIHNSGKISADDTLLVNQATVGSITNTGTWFGEHLKIGQAGKYQSSLNNSGQLSGGHIDIYANTLTNNANIDAKHRFDGFSNTFNNKGNLRSNGHVSLTQTNLTNYSGALISAKGNLNIAGKSHTNDTLNNHGKLANSGSTNINLENINNYSEIIGEKGGQWYFSNFTNHGSGKVSIKGNLNMGTGSQRAGNITNHGKLYAGSFNINNTGRLYNGSSAQWVAFEGNLNYNSTYRGSADAFENAGSIFAKGAFDINLRDDFYSHGTLESLSSSGKNRIAVSGGNIYNGKNNVSLGTIKVAGDLELAANSFINASKGNGINKEYMKVVGYDYEDSGCRGCKKKSAKFYYRVDVVNGTYEGRDGSVVQVGGTLKGKGDLWSNQSSTISADIIDVTELNRLENKTYGFEGKVDRVEFYKRFRSKGSKRDAHNRGLSYINQLDTIDNQVRLDNGTYKWSQVAGSDAGKVLSTNNYTLTDADGVNPAVIRAREFKKGKHTSLDNQGSFSAGSITSKGRGGVSGVSNANAAGDSGDPSHSNNARGHFKNGADENTIRIANRKPTATISLLSFIIPGLSFDALNAASVQGDKTPEELAAQAQLQKQLDQLGQNQSAQNKALKNGQSGSFSKQGPSLFDLDPEILQMIVADTEYELTQDYIFDKVDPDRVVDDEPKFFLDPYEEAQAITQAALQQTGEAFFSPDWNSSAEQRKGLYDNAVEYLSNHEDVKIGEALSDIQVAALDKPIIWYVTMNINGEDQLVPTVYLPEANLEQFENTRAGTMVADNMDIDVGDFTNTGDLKVSGDANISADNITNERNVHKFGDATNYGAIAGDGGNISAGNLTLTSRGDINNKGASINTTGKLDMNAQGDINLTASEMSSRNQFNKNIFESTDYLLSQISAGDDATIKAGGGFLSEAVQGDFLGNLMVDADSIDFVGIAEREYSKRHSSKKDRFSKTKKTTEKENINFIGSNFNVAKNLTLDANNDILLEGSTLNAQGEATVNAGGDFLMTAGISQASESISKKTKGMATQSAQQKGFVKQTATKSGISSGGDMTITSGGDITLVGSDLDSQGTMQLGNDVIARDENGDLLRDENGNFITEEGGTANITFTTQELRHETWNEKSSGLSGAFGKLANGAMALAGNFGIKAEIEIGRSTSERTQTTEQVSSDVSADNLIMMADQDISVIGSNVDVANDAFVSADNVIIDAAKETHTETRSETIETASSDGPSIGEDEITVASISNTQHKETESTTTTTWKGSNFNVGGNMDMNAKDTLAVISSDMEVGGNANVKTNNMIVGGRKNSTETTKTTETKTTTLGVGVRNAYVDSVKAAQAVDQAATDLDDAKQAYDDAKRKVANGELPKADLKYYEANIAAATANLAQANIAMVTAVNSAAANSTWGGFTANANATTSYSSSSETTTNSSFTGSNIKVGGNATIDAGDTFDMKGSSLSVDGALALNAKDISIRAGQDTTSSSSSSESHSASANMSSSGDMSGSMSTNESDSDSTSTTHVNSMISAGSFTSESENLTLSGANLAAGEVDITTDTLTVESLQDTSSSDSSSKGSSLGLSSSGMPTDFGVNASRDKASSAWVNNQTGIQGGTVNIKAKDTTITGGLIASTDSEGNDNGQLNLETDTLTVNNVYDHDKSSSKGVNISVSQGKDKNDKGEDVTTLSKGSTTAGAHYSGHEKEQTTFGTLGNGTITVGGKDISEDESLAEVNRDIHNSQVITKDQQRGGLDASVAVDHRLLTEEGQEEIAQDFQQAGDLAAQAAEKTVDTVTFVAEEFNRDELAAAAKSENSELMGELLVRQLEAANPNKNFTDQERQELISILGSKYSSEYDELTNFSNMKTHDDAMSSIVEGMVGDLNNLNNALNGISEDGYKKVGGPAAGILVRQALARISGTEAVGTTGAAGAAGAAGTVVSKVMEDEEINNQSVSTAIAETVVEEFTDAAIDTLKTLGILEEPNKTETPIIETKPEDTHTGGDQIVDLDNTPYSTPAHEKDPEENTLVNIPDLIGPSNTELPIEDDLGLGLVLNEDADTHEKYKDDLRRQMQRPHTSGSDSQLETVLSENYRDNAKIGSGSTADGLRHETLTGEKIKGKLHKEKAENTATFLRKWLAKNEHKANVSEIDKAAAQNVLKDLENALEVQKP